MVTQTVTQMKNDPIARGILLVLVVLVGIATLTGCDQASAGTENPPVLNARFVGTETEIHILDRSGDVRATFPRDGVSERILDAGSNLEGEALQFYADGLLDAFVFVIIDGATISLIVEATE